MEAQRIATLHLGLYKLYIELSELQDAKNKIDVDCLRAKSITQTHPAKLVGLQERQQILAGQIQHVQERIVTEQEKLNTV